MVIGRTGEMDRLHNPLHLTLLWLHYYFMFTLHQKTLQTLRHLEMDGTTRCIDGSPSRTSIYHVLPQAPRLYIHAVCDLFLFIVSC